VCVCTYREMLLIIVCVCVCIVDSKANTSIGDLASYKCIVLENCCNSVDSFHLFLFHCFLYGKKTRIVC